jgi:RNA polymerase sigma-70 factor (ECF subfamily)
VRQRRRGEREPLLEEAAMEAIADADHASHQDVDKPRYREAFAVAFRRALTQLSARDRNLLRLNLIDQLSVDELGKLYSVHRATAARWLERIRAGISHAVRHDLMRQLDADRFETEELLAWIHSRIELSLGGLASTTRRRTT